MTTSKKKGLGRGLSALFGDEKLTSKPVEIVNHNNKAPIEDLNRNRYQPRQHFDEQKLDELAQSIKKNGIIQPIAVRTDVNNSERYEIVAGERRWLAAQKAGLQEVPIVVLELDDNEGKVGVPVIGGKKKHNVRKNNKTKKRTKKLNKTKKKSHKNKKNHNKKKHNKKTKKMKKKRNGNTKSNKRNKKSNPKHKKQLKERVKNNKSK